MGFQRVHGGLERVVKSSNVERIIEKSHQGGSDRLLIMQSFIELQKTYFNGPTKELLNAFNYKLHGLATFIDYKYGSDDQNMTGLAVQFGTRIQSDLSNSSYFRHASMDAKFREVIYYYPELHRSFLSPSQNYSIVKNNVDARKLIQLGLTLFDPQGNLPNYGTEFFFVWEFNFMDFDTDEDLQNSKSIALLKRQSIDFSMNKLIGISSADFAILFIASRLSIAMRCLGGNWTWITFHSMYDFGLLVKI
ncbi:probable CCR4-associated factor 1 homolog 11 [Olea europaea var. sylvestris]|uniref:probable CCR4-associated factor 1 homolog 11 n=1 Tax=Olea europaea var. sylvestris TaxID=158386 RepID=UPI000C1D0405|nr:probable CCR4-associated factor 1 homolog 11 [Olea europaea var. sylvestris]